MIVTVDIVDKDMNGKDLSETLGEGQLDEYIAYHVDMDIINKIQTELAREKEVLGERLPRLNGQCRTGQAQDNITNLYSMH